MFPALAAKQYKSGFRKQDRTAIVLSIIIPANNESAWIKDCLNAVLRSKDVADAQIIVVANGCDDDTAEQARTMTGAAIAKGWTLDVLDIPTGNKVLALNAGDAAAKGTGLVYLDADVRISDGLLGQIETVLEKDTACFASGQLGIMPAKSWVTRAYARIYAKVPFITDGVPGAGLFAANKPGRARWDNFPSIISDDTFVRLQFKPSERIGVEAGYTWPLVEGFSNLVRVRRRQNDGVAEIASKYPELLINDAKPKLGLAGIARLFVGDPIGFAVYASVALAVKFPSRRNTDGWKRGR